MSFADVVPTKSSGWARTALLTICSALALTACNPTLSPPPSGFGPTASGATSALCSQLTQTFEARAAVGRAFQTLFDGDIHRAAADAKAIRGRLDTLIATERLATELRGPAAELRDRIDDIAVLLSSTLAAWEGRAETPLVRDVDIAGGRFGLAIVDGDLEDLAASGEAACPGAALSLVPVTFPAPPTNAQLGLPDALAGMPLAFGVSDATRMTSTFKLVGIDARSVRESMADVRLGRAFGRIDVFDGAEVPAAAIANALQDDFAEGAARQPAVVISGFKVIAYRPGPDDVAEPFHVATRGDRVVLFSGFTDALVRDVLEAMP